MLRIAVDDLEPRNWRNDSVMEEKQRRSISLPVSSSSFSIIYGGSRKSFSYSKLPEEPLKLSVLKLDGSCFHIEVMQTATVADVKQAVESVFSHVPKKGPGKISWPHVWGHFCLSHDGQKLDTETDCIRNFGIKDGDQLQFIRHVSRSYTIKRKKSKKKDIASNQNHSAQSQPTSKELTENFDEEDNVFEDIENGEIQHYSEKDEDFVEDPEFGLVQVFEGWFPYSKLSTEGRTRGYSNACPPLRFPCDIFDSFRRFIGLCGGKRHSQRDTWRSE